LALLTGCLYNWYVYPDVLSDPYVAFTFTPREKAEFENIRHYWIPITHGILCLINFLTGNPRLHLDGLKAFASFAGMIICVNNLALVSSCIWVLPQPFDWDTAGTGLKSTMIWFEVEVMVFIATLVSNGTFIILRTCMRHKI
jgi:hypothetical protein